MSLQLVAVCATAGIIVGVIALTGIGSRFSTVLLQLADQSQLLAAAALCMIEGSWATDAFGLIVCGLAWVYQRSAVRRNSPAEARTEPSGGNG